MSQPNPSLIEPKFPSAFVQWFAKTYAGDVERGAEHLLDMAATGGRGAIVWEILEFVGHREYRPETFREAARVLFRQAGIDV